MQQGKSVQMIYLISRSQQQVEVIGGLTHGTSKKIKVPAVKTFCQNGDKSSLIVQVITASQVVFLISPSHSSL